MEKQQQQHELKTTTMTEAGGEEKLLGKVTSFVRIRPRNRRDKGPVLVKVDAGKREQIKLWDGKGREKCFKFAKPEHLIDETKDQADVFNLVGRPLVDCMFDAEGCDGAVLCYGGYGMGKLHTLYETSTSYSEEMGEWGTAESLSKPSPSTSSAKKPLRTAKSIYETPILRTPGLKSGHSSHREGLLVRVVHNIFRRMVWKKFQSPSVESTNQSSRFNASTAAAASSSPNRDQRLQSPDAGSVPWSRLASMELQCSSFAVTHSGDVVDLLREGNGSEPSSRKPTGRFSHLHLDEKRNANAVGLGNKDSNNDDEEEEDDDDDGVQESMSTPTLKRTKASAMAKEIQRQMEHTHWVPCTNTVDFEATLKPALDVCHKHEEKHLREISQELAEAAPTTASSRGRKSLWSSKKDDTQFVVTQIRLVPGGRDYSYPAKAPQNSEEFFSKIAFVMVLPGETMAMEGPVLTGTHLSASMLRLRAVLDGLTGIGSKNQALLRANASLANMLSAPLGSPRLLLGRDRDTTHELGQGGGHTHGHHKTSHPPFVSLLGCVSPVEDQINQVSGFLSFAERAELATLLHANTKHQAEIEIVPQPEESSKSLHPTAIAPQHQTSTKAPALSLQTTPVAATLGSIQNGVTGESNSAKGTPQQAEASPGARGGVGGLAMIPLLTPPSARAVSKMVWPTASPSTFSEGLHDFAHIKEELENIWSVMREAERYHEEALTTAEVELHEAEAATRRAGARASEMKKIIQSLKDEIQNQKDQVAKDAGGVTKGTVAQPPSPMLGLMEGEIKQLKEQVVDEQALRREAEAAVASLDDECVRLNEKLNEMSNAKAQKGGNVKSRNVRIQCALQVQVTDDGETSPRSGGPMILGGNSSVGRREESATTANTEDDVASRTTRDSAYDEVEKEEEDHLAAKSGLFQVPSKGSVSSNGNNSSQSTPTLIAQKEEPRSSDSEIMSRDDLLRLRPAARVLDEEVQSRPAPANLNLKEMPQKQTPEEAENAVSVTTRKRHSTLVQDGPGDHNSNNDHESGDLSNQDDEEENPLVLIIAVNMYKGHTEKINIYLQDTSEAIARDFVKKHNLPEISVKNLEKLINKNLEKNKIVIGKNQERDIARTGTSSSDKKQQDSPSVDITNGAAVASPANANHHQAVSEEREKDQDDDILCTSATSESGDDHQETRSDPPTPTLLTPATKKKTRMPSPSSGNDKAGDNNRTNNTPSPIPASPATSDPGSRPLRPVDMYRFIN